MMEKAGNSWKPISMTLTASIRFEKYGAAMIHKLGLRAMVGKTTMGVETMKAMQSWGAVHLTTVGIMTNILAGQIKRVRDVYFLDELGKTEASWVLEMEKAGPFIVDIDARGNNLFHQIHRRVEKRLEEIARKFGVPEGYQYSDMNG
jgi:L(+)-tartrate dehydratase beta subunit